MSVIANTLRQISRIAAIDPSIVESITAQLAKIATIDPSIVESITTQLAKIAAIDPSVTVNVSIQIAKIAAIDPSVTVNVSIQIAKIAVIDSSIVESIITQLAKIAAIDSSTLNVMLASLVKILSSYPENTKSIQDSISDGQLLSKWWLADQVENINLGNIFLCGGWYAMILFDKKLKFNQCISFDLDPSCEFIAKTLHKQLVMDNWKFQATTGDIHDIDYDCHTFSVKRSDGSLCDLTMTPDTIINTSCEHIENFSDWWNLIPSDKLVILQSNNGFGIDGHVNCSNSLDKFTEITPLSKVLYSGEKEMPKFTRYMRIGYK
jgi:hypothetical protein